MSEQAQPTTQPAGRAATRPVTAPAPFAGVSLPPFLTLAALTAILYLARDVLQPIAVALLLTFALAPIVSFLRRRGAPRVLAVMGTVTIAFIAITIFTFVIGSQVTKLAVDIPTYQTNIIDKIRSLRDFGASGGLIDRVVSAVEHVGQEIGRRADDQGAAAPSPDQPKPMPVVVVQQTSPLDVLVNVVLPLLSPFVTAGLVVVVVIFMLMEREGLRDRFIRLIGYSDLHRTTEAIQDAATRVGRYLLMQLVINTLYAIPVALGLWLIGVPNAMLWGMLTLVLRFVPYIGPAIGMILPMLVAFAVMPGWAPLVWTGALFVLMELISNNIMEPWLYGSRTGLSPLAIIVSAIFWGWLWGPLGLVLSTPLTVCLVVLGRYVPQFEFFNVLFGNEPVLEPDARLYQRLLANDPDEATDNAEEFLEDHYLFEFYEKVGIPALLLGEADRQRGVMAGDNLTGFAGAARALVEGLQDVADEEEDEDGDPAVTSEKDDRAEPAVILPDGDGKRLLCIGGRGAIDDAAAAMVAQVFEAQSATVTLESHDTVELGAARKLPLKDVDTVVLVYLNPQSAPQARHAIRRLKRLQRGIRVGLYLPAARKPGDDLSARAGLALAAERLGADFVATGLVETVTAAFAEEKPVSLPRQRKRLAPAPRRKDAKAEAA